jgi:hypothetical protein
MRLLFSGNELVEPDISKQLRGREQLTVSLHHVLEQTGFAPLQIE